MQCEGTSKASHMQRHKPKYKPRNLGVPSMYISGASHSHRVYWRNTRAAQDFWQKEVMKLLQKHIFTSVIQMPKESQQGKYNMSSWLLLLAMCEPTNQG